MQNSSRLVFFFGFIFLSLAIPTQGQNLAGLVNKVKTAEAGVRAKLPRRIPPLRRVVEPNDADDLFATLGVSTSRVDRPVAALSAISLPVAKTLPIVIAAPPNLPLPTFYGSWPDTGHCRFQLPIRGDVPQGATNPGCNDTLSHLDVPLNVTVRLCEHDGVGQPQWGDCYDFGVGSHGVVPSFNDKATTFWVRDTNVNYVYFTSASDEVPSGFEGTVTYRGNTDGDGKVDITFKVNRNWYTKTYAITLPTWCANPDVWQSTKVGDSEWSHTIQSGVLKIVLKVKPKIPTTGNNWVGVGIRCKP